MGRAVAQHVQPHDDSDFDITILRTECFYGKPNPVVGYSGKMVVIPIIIILLLLYRLVTRYLGGIKVGKVGPGNTIGGALNVLFVGMCLMSVEPFQLFRTPLGQAHHGPRDAGTMQFMTMPGVDGCDLRVDDG